MRIFGALLTLAFIGLIMVGAAAAYMAYIMKMDSTVDAETYIVIEPGTSLKGIAQQLEVENIISPTAAVIFPYASKLDQPTVTLKAGEYQVTEGMSAFDIMRLMKSGKTVQRQLTVPEGLTSIEVVSLINAAEFMQGDEITEIPAEGSLLPESFSYTRTTTKQQILDRMQRDMENFLDRIWDTRVEDLPFNSREEAVILASIIEKETGVAAEREKVAGVFINRLRINMPLQTDPTVIYAITEGRSRLDRPLYYRDLRIEHPYNTYVNRGLPPGPIANPGKASIMAALNPAEHDYLYFVADGSGGHAFGRTLEEHNQNVARWRQIQRERQNQPD